MSGKATLVKIDARAYDLIVVEDAHSTYDTKILKAPQIMAHYNSIFGGRFAKLKKVEEIDFNNL